MATEQARDWIRSRPHSRPVGWKPPKVTGHQKDQIRQRVADGEDIRDLATEYGVSARTIRLYAT